MGKNGSGKSIAILAFILAASGLGFGGFSFMYFSNLIPTSTTTGGESIV